MSYVAINVLSVPEAARGTVEERFAGRRGVVESSPGFEHFELLRPLEGTQDYLVYTRWASEADFQAWREAGAAQVHGGPEGQKPAATGATLWTFEVVQSS